jgi:hypothetical protein
MIILIDLNQAMVEEQRQLIAGFHKENAELRATISKQHDKEVRARGTCHATSVIKVSHTVSGKELFR